MGIGQFVDEKRYRPGYTSYEHNQAEHGPQDPG
jgi:hypothetical protein